MFLLVWFTSDSLGYRPRPFAHRGFYVNIGVKLKKGKNSQVDNPNSCPLFSKKEMGAIQRGNVLWLKKKKKARKINFLGCSHFKSSTKIMSSLTVSMHKRSRIPLLDNQARHFQSLYVFISAHNTMQHLSFRLMALIHYLTYDEWEN